MGGSHIRPKATRINDKIDAPKVRLIAADGEQVGIVNIADALLQSKQAGLDLVEISPHSEPPVCRLMDYTKNVFNRKKKQAGQKKSRTQVKGMNFRPNTDIGDYNVKLNKIKKFIESGHKVKILLRFRGREMQHQDLGLTLLKRIEGDLEGLVNVEQAPKLEGRQMMMLISAAKK